VKVHADRAPALADAGSAPPLNPRAALKPPSHFEACLAAIRALGGREAYPPEGTEAWACAFGDDGHTPNNLSWFESCASEASPRCE
jgi:hypothetical protein